MVNVFGNEIIGAFTNGVTVKSIYANGELVWPTFYYYVLWDSSYYTGTFSMNGNTYSYESYYPRNKFSSPNFSGTITSRAFRSGPFSYVETNATYIDNLAFYTCSSLTNVNLPMCSYIGDLAFYSCHSLTSISLPVCEYIGSAAFYDCYLLTSIDLPMCSYISNGAFLYCRSLSSVNLPVCSYVGDGAFDDCRSLTQVNLPVCSYVGNEAFFNCSSLTSIDFPMCSYVGYEAFENCYSLTSVSLPVCEYIGSYAFALCSSLSSISLPVCSYIGSSTFALCSSLSTITLESNSVCVLYSSDAFYSTQITSSTGSIFVPSSLVPAYKTDSVWSYFWSRIYSIGYIPPEYYYVKWDSSNYTGFFSMNGRTYQYSNYYPSNCFSSSDFSGTITSSAFKSGPFSYMETNAENIMDYAFDKCSRLRNVSLPVCKYIGQRAFRSCSSLKSINLPICEYIDYAAFYYCSSLSTITLGWNSVCSLSGYLDGITFSTGSIFVPASLVNAYKSALNWSAYSNRIFPIP